MTLTEPTLSELGQEAVKYAELGWHVFPLHTPRPGDTCSCRKRDCENQGKHPRTQHGLNDATNDASKIAVWWGMWPDANIGISCGPSGIVAIDVDPRHGGDESLGDLKQKWGKEAFQTVSAATGGGGEHYIYQAPAGIPIGNVTNSPKYTSPLGPGIDVRANGGYIVAPPSLHRSGAFYDWYTGESPFDRKPQRLPLPFIEVLETRDSRPTTSAPISAADILAGVPAGERDWKLFQLAAKLRYSDVPIDFAYSLVGHAAANCVPPFPAEQARRKVDSAYKRYEAGSGAFVEEAEAKAEGALTGRQLLGPMILDGPPETLWLINDLVVRGCIHMLYGEPESGKTIIALSWALQAISRGQRVLYIDEESGISSVSGLLRDMGADPELVDKLIHYFPFPDIGKDSYNALLAYADDFLPDLILFDSLTDMLSAAGLDENSGIEVTSWMNEVATALARRPYLPSVVLIDHVPKDTENIRYSVASRAKKAKSDVLWYVRKSADFDREHTAAVDLERHKNRPGVLPKKVRYTVGGSDGTLICRRFDASQDDIETEPPKAKIFYEILLREGPKGRKEMESLVGLGHDATYQIAEFLVRAGKVERAGYGRSLKYIPIVRSDDTNRLPDDSQSSGESSDFVPPYRGQSDDSRLGRRKPFYWQEKDQEEKQWS